MKDTCPFSNSDCALHCNEVLIRKITGIEKENRESDSRSNELMRKHWRPMQQSENKLGGTETDCKK